MWNWIYATLPWDNPQAPLSYTALYNIFHRPKNRYQARRAINAPVIFQHRSAVVACDHFYFYIVFLFIYSTCLHLFKVHGSKFFDLVFYIRYLARLMGCVNFHYIVCILFEWMLNVDHPCRLVQGFAKQTVFLFSLLCMLYFGKPVFFSVFFWF